MESILLGAMEFDEKDLSSLSSIQYKDMRIHLGKEQKFELSDSKKTIYIVQYDDNKEIGRKGFRISNCLFFQDIYD